MRTIKIEQILNKNFFLLLSRSDKLKLNYYYIFKFKRVYELTNFWD